MQRRCPSRGQRQIAASGGEGVKGHAVFLDCGDAEDQPAVGDIVIGQLPAPVQAGGAGRKAGLRVVHVRQTEDGLHAGMIDHAGFPAARQDGSIHLPGSRSAGRRRQQHHKGKAQAQRAQRVPLHNSRLQASVVCSIVPYCRAVCKPALAERYRKRRKNSIYCPKTLAKFCEVCYILRVM